MSNIAEKLTTIAENQQKLYDKGMSDNESEFWDDVQNSGNRSNYAYAFQYWASEYIRPSHKVMPSGNGAVFNGLCAYSLNLKKVESKYFDLSKTTPATNVSTSCNYNLFINCPSLEEVEDIGIQGGGYYSTFRNCSKLHTIAMIRCVEEGAYAYAFAGATSLVNLGVAGTIGTNIDFSDCSLLSDASLENIAQHLKDFLPEWEEGDGNKATIALHETVKERIKNTEIENLIKGKKWGIV